MKAEDMLMGAIEELNQRAPEVINKDAAFGLEVMHVKFVGYYPGEKLYILDDSEKGYSEYEVIKSYWNEDSEILIECRKIVDSPISFTALVPFEEFCVLFFGNEEDAQEAVSVKKRN